MNQTYKHIMDKIMIDMKCHPPHWTPTSQVPLCSNSKEMRKFATAKNIASNDYEPPCKSIARVDYNYLEHDEIYIDRKIFGRYKR